MVKRPGNRNFGKPDVPVAPSSQSAFETVVQSLRLSPDQYPYSPALRDWIAKNKDHKYVPPSVLKALGFEVADDL